MEPERWAAIESLYHAALEREPAERGLWLRQACGDDTRLLREVESLLACAGASLSNPEARPELAKLFGHLAVDPEAGAEALSVGEAASADAASAPTEVPRALPSTIGRYRILRLLGEGGMGVVYEAEQEQPRRTVALKVIKSGLAGVY